LNDKDQKLNGIINKLFTKEDRLSRAYNEFSIDQIWRETFGSLIASYTTSVKYHKGALTVYISSAPLKQEKYKKVDKIFIR